MNYTYIKLNTLSGNLFSIFTGITLMLLLVSASGNTVKAQTISHFAGNGISRGDNGPASAAKLYLPTKVRSDMKGNVYILDASNNRLRKVDTAGIITTYAGSGASTHTGDGGPAISAGLGNLQSINVDNTGNIYIGQSGVVYYNFDTIRGYYGSAQSWVRMINTAGIIVTVAGTGDYGVDSGDGGPATAARFQQISDVVPDNHGNIYVVNNLSNSIRKINSAGIITHIAGNGYSLSNGDGGPASSAGLAGPNSLKIDAAGNIYIVESSGNRIRKINTAGIITTIAGNGAHNFYGDGGPANASELANPTDLTIDTSGNIFIADNDNYVVRMINTAGIINTVAGIGIPGTIGDGGSAVDAEFRSLTGIEIDRSGNTYISDNKAQNVRKIAPWVTAGVKSIQGVESIEILPQPNNGRFCINISSSMNIPVQIKISDITGRNIKELIATTNNKVDIVLNVSPGIYFVTTITEQGKQTAKIVVE